MLNLIFAWINFGITLGLARYVYLRWFKINIAQIINKNKDHLFDLNTELSTLENQVREIAIDLALQAQLASSLLTKVQNWANAYQHTLILNARQTQLIQAQIDLRNQLKIAYLATSLAQKKMFTQVLTQAEQALLANFASQGQAQAFLNSVLDNLKQG